MSEKTTNPTDLASSLVEYARSKGAAEAEVVINEGSQFTAIVRNGELETLTEAGSKNLQLRVFVDHKAATASSSDFAKATLTRLVDNAVARAKLGGKDPFAGLPDLEKVTVDAAKLKLRDPAVAAMPPEKKIDYAKKVEAIALKQKGVQMSLGSRFITNVGTRTLVNSKGFSGSYDGTVAYSVIILQAGEGDNLFQDYWFEGGTQLAKLPEPEVLAKKAAERVTRLIGARKVETQVVPVVVQP